MVADALPNRAAFVGGGGQILYVVVTLLLAGIAGWREPLRLLAAVLTIVSGSAVYFCRPEQDRGVKRNRHAGNDVDLDRRLSMASSGPTNRSASSGREEAQ